MQKSFKSGGGRLWIIALAAGAVGLPAIAKGQVDQFESFFSSSVSQGGTNAMGGFAYDSTNNVFYTAGFSGATQALRKITFSGGSWTGTPYVGLGDWVQSYLSSSSLTDNGGSGTVLPVTFSSGDAVGDIVLNPKQVTVGGIVYAPGTLGVIVDQATIRDTSQSPSVVQPQYSKEVYVWDLRQTGTIPAPGSRDRNGNGNIDWNDVFDTVATMQDMQTVQSAFNGTPVTATTVNNARRFAFSTDGQSIYFNDAANVFGGIWKVNLTLTGAAALTKVVDSRGSTSMNSEPDVIPTTLRNFGGGTGDQVVFSGTPESGNDRGLTYIVDNGTSGQIGKALLTSKQISVLYDGTATPNIAGVTHDSSGNIYFTNGTSGQLYMLDTQGRLAKIFSNAEQRVFDANSGATTFNVLVLDTVVRNKMLTLGGNSVAVPEILFNDASSIRTPVGVLAYTPGDFNRDGVVNAADVALFTSNLGLRGAVAASILTSSPFTQSNANKMKFDLNGSFSTTVGGVAAQGVSIDWKDVKVFQQYAGLSDGDVNMDFAVNYTDLSTIGTNYNLDGKLFTQGNLTSVRVANSDKDTVNYGDLVTLAANWTLSTPTTADLDANGYTGTFRSDVIKAFAVGGSGLPHQLTNTTGGALTWSTAANWSNGVPNHVDDAADLLTKPGNDTVMTVDGTYTVGQLNFDSPFSYTLAGGTLTMQSSVGNAQLNTFAASPTITTGLALASNTDVTITYSADSVTLAGAISGTGGLNKLGAGLLTLSGANSFSGVTNLSAGTFAITNSLALQNSTLNYVSSGIALTNANLTAVTLGGLSGDKSFSLTNGASQNVAITVGGNGNSSTYSGSFTGTGSLTKVGAGTLTVSALKNTNVGVTVSAGTLLVAQNGGNAGTSVLNTLSVGASGKLDLNDNDLVLNYSTTSPAATIRALLASGFNAGGWDGNGIASLAAHADASSLTALGYADVASTTFNGVAISKAVIVKYTYYGDSNLDGLVNATDFSAFLDGLAGGGSTWSQGDYTYDGVVDLGNDFNLFLSSYIASGSQLGDLESVIAGDGNLSGSQKAQLLSVVPEPASLSLIGVGAIALLSRRRPFRAGGVSRNG